MILVSLLMASAYNVHRDQVAFDLGHDGNVVHTGTVDALVGHTSNVVDLAFD